MLISSPIFNLQETEEENGHWENPGISPFCCPPSNWGVCVRVCVCVCVYRWFKPEIGCSPIGQLEDKIEREELEFCSCSSFPFSWDKEQVLEISLRTFVPVSSRVNFGQWSNSFLLRFLEKQVKTMWSQAIVSTPHSPNSWDRVIQS